MNHQKSVQMHESDAVSKAALSPAMADVQPRQQPDAPAADDVTGIFGGHPVENTRDGTISEDLPDSRDSHTNIFDKNNRATWLVISIVIASVVGWILLHAGVIQ